MEIKPGSKDSFDGSVRELAKELEESTATVTVSAANPMIALKSAKKKAAKDKSGSGKEKKDKKEKKKNR
jgi:hypothetical protein